MQSNSFWGCVGRTVSIDLGSKQNESFVDFDAAGNNWRTLYYYFGPVSCAVVVFGFWAVKAHQGAGFWVEISQCTSIGISTLSERGSLITLFGIGFRSF